MTADRDPSRPPGPHPSRLNRSELAVPGSNPRFIDRAARSAADVVFLDLEDSVPADGKPAARQRVIEALNDVDWGPRTVAVRVNGPDTAWMYRDVVEVAERCPRLDLIILPKVRGPGDVYALDLLLGQIEQAQGRTRPLGIEGIIETARALSEVEAIARAAPRLEALSLGPGDLAAALGARTTDIGGASPDYGVLAADGSGRRRFHPGDMWHYTQARVLVAARAAGLRPVDGPWGDPGDGGGLEAAARRAAALGFAGKWVIHPDQIAPVNGIFSPSAEEIAAARRILEAVRAADRAGRAAVMLDGRMVDLASRRMAERLLARAEAIAARAAAS